MSRGTKASIGVGASVAGCLIIAGLLYLPLRTRRRRTKITRETEESETRPTNRWSGHEKVQSWPSCHTEDEGKNIRGLEGDSKPKELEAETPTIRFELRGETAPSEMPAYEAYETTGQDSVK